MNEPPPTHRDDSDDEAPLTPGSVRRHRGEWRRVGGKRRRFAWVQLAFAVTILTLVVVYLFVSGRLTW